MHLHAQENFAALLDAYAGAGGSASKGVRGSWGSFLVNASLLLSSSSQLAADKDARAVALSAAVELLSSCPEQDTDTLFRCRGFPLPQDVTLATKCQFKARSCKCACKSMLQEHRLCLHPVQESSKSPPYAAPVAQGMGD